MLVLRGGFVSSLEKKFTHNNAKTNISKGQDSSTNIIRVDSIDGFNVGDLSIR